MDGEYLEVSEPLNVRPYQYEAMFDGQTVADFNIMDTTGRIIIMIIINFNQLLLIGER